MATVKTTTKKTKKAAPKAAKPAAAPTKRLGLLPGADDGTFAFAVRVKESSALQIALMGVETQQLRAQTAVLLWDQSGVRTKKATGLWATTGSVAVGYVVAAGARKHAAKALLAAVVDVLSAHAGGNVLSVVDNRVQAGGKSLALVEEQAAGRGLHVVALTLHLTNAWEGASDAVRAQETRLKDLAKGRLPTNWIIVGRISRRFVEGLAEAKS